MTRFACFLRAALPPAALSTALLSTALSLPAALQAQASAPRSEAAVREDLRFARGLATNWQFGDLADEVLIEVERLGYPRSLAGEVELARCDVYAAAARVERDPAAREQLYLKSLAGYRVYLSGNPYGEQREAAQAAFIALCSEFGRSMETVLDDALAEDAARIRASVEDYLTEAVTLTGELVAAIRGEGEISEQRKRDLHRTMLARGQMLVLLGRIAADSTFPFSQAEQTLQTLGLEAGERSFYGLMSYLELARLYVEQGKVSEAVDYSTYVADAAIPINADDWAEIRKDLSADDIDVRWRFLQMATPIALEALGRGETPADTAARALHFVNSWKTTGVQLGSHGALGSLALLSVSRALINCGGFVGGDLNDGSLRWFETAEAMQGAGFTGTRRARSALDLALSFAQQVNQENRGSNLQVRAQRVISEVIDQPGVVVATSVLFEAAEGLYFDKDYAGAVRSLKRVLRALDTQDKATRDEFGGKVFASLGDSYRRLERPLEAAMAYREGATTWRGDPESDKKNANGFNAAVLDLRRAVPGDAQIEALYEESQSLVELLNKEDAGEVVYSRAMRAYEEKDYATAHERFAAVQPGSASYEKAIAFSGLSLYRDKDFEGARKVFEEYLDVYVKDPTHATNSAQQRTMREQARAVATLYLAQIHFRTAEQAHRATPGSGDFAAVIQLLQGYEDEFASQTSYAAEAMRTSALALLNLPDLERAEQVYTRMRERFPQESATSRTAIDVYKALSAQHELALKANDAAAAQALLARMADNMRQANSGSANPSFANLRRESQHWMDLGNWTEAERVLRELERLFAADAERAKDLALYVRPDLGRALLRQRKMPEALAILAPLVPDPTATGEDAGARPSQGLVQDYARAAVGWIEAEGEAQNLVEVPGAGDLEAQKKARQWLIKLLSAQPDKYVCTWYELQFELGYASLQLGQKDSAALDDLRAQFRTLTTDLGPRFEAYDCEDKVLLKKLLWLTAKAR
jgi:hypothetical protein